MSDLVKRQEPSGALQIQSVDDLHRVSTILATSGFFSDAKDAAQCAVKVMAGLEMGFGAFSAMSGIHIIKGKPSVGANLMAAAVKRHPNYNYRVLEHSDQVCRIAFYERWNSKLEQVGESAFTLADAKKAGVQNLDKFARNMLFARAMSNGVKWYCPDVFGPAAYTSEELGEPEYEDQQQPEAIDVQASPEGIYRRPQDRIKAVNKVLNLSRDVLQKIADGITEQQQPQRGTEMINEMLFSWASLQDITEDDVDGVLSQLHKGFPDLVDEDLVQAAVSELSREQELYPLAPAKNQGKDKQASEFSPSLD